MNTSFWKSGHTPTLFAAFLYFDLSFMVWYVLGPLAVQIATALDLTAGSLTETHNSLDLAVEGEQRHADRCVRERAVKAALARLQLQQVPLGAAGATGSADTANSTAARRSSWQMKVGLRYKF